MKQTPGIVVLAVLVMSVGASDSKAQVLSGGLAPLENASAAGARAPGNMVTAGIGRRQEVLSGPFRSFSSISNPGTPSLVEGFRATASAVIAVQLSIALDLLIDSLIDRSGILDTDTEATPAPAPDDGGRTPVRGKLLR